MGAFVSPPAVLARGASNRPLSGCRLGVKDLFDVAGTVTGAGNPTFAAGRTPSPTSAVAVERLVAAGATVVGKTITDEMAWSLSGTNVHDGTPRNVAAPGRVPGGSSAGSAAALAAGIVELALGTDTGGSIRVPASYCGILGWRPTHGATPNDGVVPLAPSFDTVGLLAADARVLEAGALALLDEVLTVNTARPELLLLGEALADVAPAVAAATVASVRAELFGVRPLMLGVDLDEALQAFRHLQGWEAWQAHGDWVATHHPAFGPGVAARFEFASRVTTADVSAANVVRDHVRTAVADATADGTVLVQPAAAGPAPELPHGSPADRTAHEAQRLSTLRLTCVAGLAGAPVVVLPLARVDDLPLGIAFVGAPGTDRDLLELARWQW